MTGDVLLSSGSGERWSAWLLLVFSAGASLVPATADCHVVYSFFF